MIWGVALHAAVLTLAAWATGALDAPCALAIVLLTGWTLAEARSQYGTDRSQDAPSMALGLCLFAVVLAAVTDPAPGLWLGTVPLVVGIVLRVVAVRTLGAAFITAPHSNTEPVQTGIYAWVRHPSEVGNLLLAIGVAWMGGSALASLMVLFAVLPLVLWRVHREDRWWLTHGTPAHRAWASDRPAFIPRRRRP